ncbi:hypothetical protein P7E02_18990 [Enterococcus hulanensis]|uniref:hypothetical protein n=1 Tax=Enterococcus hulanensis TaxID=2559929 RepID=UPI002891153B|nr:hypothetical protein [Enterococcus hulanensis]MDT2661974.1 hypothetical protein [Enterococcus hulanensis]
MKKILFVVMGTLLVGTFMFNSAGVSGEENVETQRSEAKEFDGEFIDPDENKPKITRSTAGSRTVKIENIYLKITDEAKKEPSVPMPNTNISVLYILNGKETLLHEGKTNEKGEVTGLSFPNIPNEVTSLIVRYYLGNTERGFIQKYNKRPYTFHLNRPIPANSVINFSSTSARFGVAGNTDTFFYNYQAAKLNYYYDVAVKEFSDVIVKTNDLFPKTVPFSVEPINMNFEKGKFVDQYNAFFRYGHDNSKIADIIIGDRSDRVFTDSLVLGTVMHEWTHWNSYRETQLSLEKPETTPFQIRNSYREGWAHLVGQMYSRDFNLSNEDLLVQNDNRNGVNRYFGKPTAMTVKHVLWDLMDITSQDEEFYLTHRYVDDNLTELEMKKLNLGLLHTIMVESKATTLQEFLNYMENKYILTTSDMKKYKKVLEVNGLNRDGSFKFSEDGSPLTKNSSSVQENEFEGTACSEFVE